MILSEAERLGYAEHGFFEARDRIPSDIIRRVRAEGVRLAASSDPSRVLESHGGSLRALHGAQLRSQIFADFTRLEPLLGVARALLGRDDVYLLQLKLNTKAAFVGGQWEWHQDSVFWVREDQLPRTDVVSVFVFLDEVTEFNGPLTLITGSHRYGVLEPGTLAAPSSADPESDWQRNFSAKLKYGLPQEQIRALLQSGEMVAPKGPAGTVLFADCNIVHASGVNLSDRDRHMCILHFAPTDNVPGAPIAQRRPDFLVSHDTKPLEPLSLDVMRASPVWSDPIPT